VASSGLHSNGFSLVRKVVARAGLAYSAPCPWDAARTLGAALLEPTRIYVRSLLPVARRGLLKAMAHITGGGFVENVPRVLPPGTGCAIDARAWTLPGVFRWLVRAGGVAPTELARTFNCGVGMVLVVARTDVSAVEDALRAAGEDVFRIGEVTDTPGVEMRGLEAWENVETDA
jgi:phosphoribosylamine--glycine ligase/phosphoribosylformylglycinamidine cyclo-ligase